MTIPSPHGMQSSASHPRRGRGSDGCGIMEKEHRPRAVLLFCQGRVRPWAQFKKPFHAVRFPHIDAYIVLIVIGGQEIPLPLPGKDDGVAPALEQGEGKFPAADPPRHGIDAGGTAGRNL